MAVRPHEFPAALRWPVRPYNAAAAFLPFRYAGQFHAPPRQRHLTLLLATPARERPAPPLLPVSLPQWRCNRARRWGPDNRPEQHVRLWPVTLQRAGFDPPDGRAPRDSPQSFRNRMASPSRNSQPAASSAKSECRPAAPHQWIGVGHTMLLNCFPRRVERNNPRAPAPRAVPPPKSAPFRRALGSGPPAGAARHTGTGRLLREREIPR